MKRVILLLGVVVLFALSFLHPREDAAVADPVLWQVRSIDTMKFSRDPSREKLNDPSFDLVIASQVQSIAKMGATHVAIATPYDEEFLPMLKRWVQAARKNNLHVWFRGNWSGWEGWFGYPKIDRETHKKKAESFILNNKDLFADGDIFSGCPECENGGPGDPRKTHDVAGYRSFLIEEHRIAQAAFSKIGKRVDTTYNSMNGDVARLIMDKDTTKKLGGNVVIDHYVKSPSVLTADIKDFANRSGGNIILGEFGVPILDINGEMTNEQQATWLSEAFEKMVAVPELKGMNYWVSFGGSTEIFNKDGTPRDAALVISKYFVPHYMSIEVIDPLGDTINDAQVSTLNRTFMSKGPAISIPVIGDEQRITVSAEGYETKFETLALGQAPVTVILSPKSENLSYKMRKLLKFLLRL